MANFTDVEIIPANLDFVRFQKPGYTIVFALLFILLGLISLCGNLLIIYIYTRVKGLRKAAAPYYTVSLAFINCVLSVLAIRIGFDVFFKFKTGPISSLYCNTEGTIVAFLHIQIMLLTVLMLVERYTVVTSSRNKLCLLVRKRPYSCSLFAAILSVLVALPPTSKSVSDYSELNVLYSCIFDYNTLSQGNTIYLLTMLGTIFFGPFICLCFCMVRIQQEMNRSIQSLANFSHASRTEKASINKTIIFKMGLGKLTSSEVIVLRRLCIMAICYLLSWTPISSLILLRIFSGFQASAPLTALSFLLAKTSCVHSTYIYITKHQRIAATKLLTIFRVDKTDSTATRETTNTNK